MKHILIIEADENDADYVVEQTDVTLKTMETIQPVIEAIKAQTGKPNGKYGKHNYPCGECHRGDLGEKSAEELYGHLGKAFEIFNNMCPIGEYGIHTISSIQLLTVTDEQELL